MAVLTERPNIIKRLFGKIEEEKYQIQLYDGGSKISLEIDSYIPCCVYDSELRPKFCYSQGTDVWALLLEKAAAKLFKNYHNLEGGHTAEALHLLTGAPTGTWKYQKHEGQSLWGRIDDAMKHKWLLNVEDQKHAYSIIHAQQVITKDKQTRILILIRDPWGNDQLGNPFKDWPVEWEYVEKSITHFQPTSTRWLFLEDLMANFSAITCCYYHDNYATSSQILKTNSSFTSIFTISAPEECVYVMVQQRFTRHFKNRELYSYSEMSFVLIDNNTNKRIGNEIKGDNQALTKRVTLNRGSYRIEGTVKWCKKNHVGPDITVSLYAEFAKLDPKCFSLFNE